MNTKRNLAFPLAAMAAALLTAYGPAQAEDEELAVHTKPVSEVAVGVGYLSDDAPRFGLYSGLRDDGVYGLFDVDVVRRDDATGTWFKITGRNLGLSSRELRISHERQGQWDYFLDYSAIPRYEPYTVTTGVTGIGTAALTVPVVAVAGSAVDLKTKREIVGVGFKRKLENGFSLSLTARNDEKSGARVFARGTPGAFEFTPEPIDSNTSQWEALLGFTGEKLQLTAGYFGSAFQNANSAMTVSGGAAALRNPAAPGIPFTPIALAPDNQSHQLSLAGGYSITPTTRSTFKLAYGVAKQNDAFIGVAMNPALAGVTDLGAEVTTKQAQFGITSRPLPKLSLLANFRYEDRDDNTPARTYITGAAANATWSGQNEPRSITTTSSKLEASYQLPLALRLTGGAEYVEKERSLFAPAGFIAPRTVSFRDKTEETSYRIEVRRTMSETLTGSLAYVKSDRDGTPFLTNGGAVPSNRIAPLHLADRQRDKIGMMLNWMPVEPLSVQLSLDTTKDDYVSRGVEEYGLRDGKATNGALDVSYAINDDWQVNGWLSRNNASANQATRTAANPVWTANLVHRGRSYGFGLSGQATAKLAIGLDLSHSEYLDAYRQVAVQGPAVTSPPDINTRQSTAKLFANYTLRKNATLRFDYVYDRFASDDWTWSSWTYTDGTTLRQDPRQEAHFFGVTYIYRFH